MAPRTVRRNATLEAGLMPPFYRLEVRRPSELFDSGVYEQSFSAGVSVGAGISLVPDITYQNEMRSLLAANTAGEHRPERAAVRTAVRRDSWRGV